MESKNELMADLYGIRSGLSVISQYADEVRKIEDIIAEEKEEIPATKYYIDLERKKLDLAKSGIETIEKSIIEAKQRIQETESSNIKKNVFKKIFKASDIGSMIFGAIAGFLISYVAVCVLGLFLATLLGKYMYLGFIIGLLAYPVFSTIKKIRLYNYEQKNISRENKMWIKSWKEDLSEYYISLKRCNDEYQTHYNRIQQLENEILRHKQTISIYEQKLETESKELIAKSLVMENALRETYDTVLDESDWGNIDLIIHYLETGRADSLKEALLQVDRQLQTNQIVEAIGKASEAICNHIHSAFSSLGQALAISFTKLDNSIKGISTQLANNNKNAEKLYAQVNERLDMQISESQIQTALLEQSNKSSSELLEDLRYYRRFWVD